MERLDYTPPSFIREGGISGLHMFTPMCVANCLSLPCDRAAAQALRPEFGEILDTVATPHPQLEDVSPISFMRRECPSASSLKYTLESRNPPLKEIHGDSLVGDLVFFP